VNTLQAVAAIDQAKANIRDIVASMGDDILPVARIVEALKIHPAETIEWLSNEINSGEKEAEHFVALVAYLAAISLAAGILANQGVV